MSKILRNTALASALLATLLLAAPAAFAVTLDNGNLLSPLPMKVANVAFNGGTAPGVALNQLNVNISSSDLIVGRTTGFSVRVDLPSNVTFASLPTPSIGSALPCSGASCWTVTLAGGGTSSDSYAVFSVQPGANSQGITSGTALTFASGAITGGSYPNYTFSGLAIIGQGVGNLLTIGNSVAAKVTFADPNTAQQILTPVTQTLVVSANPLVYSVASSSNLLKKIDVGSAVVASKTGYSSDGTLNKSPSEPFFDAGTPTIRVAAGVEDLNNVGFGWSNTDTLNLTVTGTFTAFMQAGAKVVLISSPLGAFCSATPSSVIATGTVTASQITFSGVSLGSMWGHAATLCFVVPGSNAQVIDATTVSTAATVTRASSGKSDNGTGNGLAMAYNGPVAVVYTFNPAGNTNQQSFLRISNTGAASGLVTITAKDDSGAAAAGSISTTLGAGKSIQLTSTDLENGNSAKGLTGSLGVGSGKWILTVTGEISGMEVTNLNRNNTSGTLSNLDRPVGGAH